MNDHQDSSKKSKKSGKKRNKKQIQNPKKDIHPVLFFFCMIQCLYLSFFLLPLLKSGPDQATVYILSLTASSFGIIIFFVASCVMSNSKCEMLCFFVLLDNIFITFVAATVGIIGLAIIGEAGLANDLAITINRIECFLTALCFFVIGGGFRILLANGNWKIYQIIIAKLVIVTCTLGYMVLAADLMIFDWATGALKDFIFLYTFGIVTFFFQIYGKITDLDGTGDLKYRYNMVEEEQQENESLGEDRIVSHNTENQFNPINESINPFKKSRFDSVKANSFQNRND